MSGWSDFTSVAKSALLSAQKRIDTVLDIRDEQDEDNLPVAAIPVESSAETSGNVRSRLQTDFFSAFGLSTGATDVVATDEDASSTKADSAVGGASSLLGVAAPQLKMPTWFNKEKKQKKDASEGGKSGGKGWGKWLGTTPPPDDDNNSTTSANAQDAWMNDVNEEKTEQIIEIEPHADLLPPSCSNNSPSNTATPSPRRRTQSDYEDVDLLAPADDNRSKKPDASRAALKTAPTEPMMPARTADALESSTTMTTTTTDIGGDWMTDSGWGAFDNELVVESEPNPIRDSHPASGSSLEMLGRQSPTVPLSTSTSTLLNSSHSDSGQSVATLVASAASPSTSPERHDRIFLDNRPQNESVPPVEKDDDSVVLDVVSDVVERVHSASRLSCHEEPITVSVAGDASDMLPESYVDVGSGTTDSSPPLSHHKSETSSMLKGGSGYTSPAEELETAASSDIEIISTPNGDNWSERSYRSNILATPHFPSTAFRTPKERRMFRRVGSDHSLSSDFAQQSSSDRPNATHLAEVLENREKRLIDMSQENARLLEENEEMLHRMKDSAQAAERTEAALNNLREKYSKICEERDTLKQRVDGHMKELGSGGATVQQLQRVLQQKEQQIQELLKEGEKLSEKELKHSKIIKKIREKEKETEKMLENQRTKLAEMDALKQKLKEREEQELKYDEAVHQLRANNERLEKRVKKLEAEKEDASEKQRSMKVSVDGCYQQISELHRELAAKNAEIQTLSSKAEASKERELAEQIELMETGRESERRSLIRQLDDMRVNSAQSSEEASRVEESLRWEVSQLQKKLQEAELRNQELSDSISSATQPLLRQIESLQNSHSVQQANWERLEKALYERVADAERKLLRVEDTERVGANNVLQLQNDAEALRRKMASMATDNSALESEVQNLKRDRENWIEVRAKYASDQEVERQLHRRALDELQQEKELLTVQFEYERTQIKQSFDKRIEQLTTDVQEKERMVTSLRSQLLESQLAPKRSLAETRTVDGDLTPRLGRSRSPSNLSLNADESGDELWSASDFSGPSGFSSLVERLRTRLQQREGELGVLRDELRSMQHSRDRAIARLSDVQRQVDEMSGRMDELDALRTQLKDLNGKHHALLQMYGEKVERVEELQLDLSDVKAMYKQQIEHLLQSTT
uniref:TATA element modulatory factor 1 TATA binding domain-containing protein n=1 Tax=Plectus sambesii TaxID=2011161 RepID=A0A914VM23_9BILA